MRKLFLHNDYFLSTMIIFFHTNEIVYTQSKFFSHKRKFFSILKISSPHRLFFIHNLKYRLFAKVRKTFANKRYSIIFCFFKFFSDDFWVSRRRTYLGQKQNSTLGKKFFSPTHIKVCVTNKPNRQRFRGYIQTINIRQNTILFLRGFLEIFGKK